MGKVSQAKYHNSAPSGFSWSASSYVPANTRGTHQSVHNTEHSNRDKAAGTDLTARWPASPCARLCARPVTRQPRPSSAPTAKRKQSRSDQLKAHDQHRQQQSKREVRTLSSRVPDSRAMVSSLREMSFSRDCTSCCCDRLSSEDSANKIRVNMTVQSKAALVNDLPARKSSSILPSPPSPSPSANPHTSRS